MLNKVILMGRITVEPELKHTPSGVAVTRFTIAVERNFKDANGERAVDFINIAAWRNNAEVVCKYFHKGSLLKLQVKEAFEEKCNTFHLRNQELAVNTFQHNP